MGTDSFERVKKHRDGLRAQGLRAIQIWIPDAHSEGFAQECRRQALLIAQGPSEAQELAWGEAVADRSGWE